MTAVLPFTGPATGTITFKGETFDLSIAEEVVAGYDRILRSADKAERAALINFDVLSAHWAALRLVVLQPVISELESAHRSLRAVGRTLR